MPTCSHSSRAKYEIERTFERIASGFIVSAGSIRTDATLPQSGAANVGGKGPAIRCNREDHYANSSRKCQRSNRIRRKHWSSHRTRRGALQIEQGPWERQHHFPPCCRLPHLDWPIAS